MAEATPTADAHSVRSSARSDSPRIWMITLHDDDAGPGLSPAEIAQRGLFAAVPYPDFKSVYAAMDKDAPPMNEQAANTAADAAIGTTSSSSARPRVSVATSQVIACGESDSKGKGSGASDAAVVEEHEDAEDEDLAESGPAAEGTEQGCREEHPQIDLAIPVGEHASASVSAVASGAALSSMQEEVTNEGVLMRRDGGPGDGDEDSRRRGPMLAPASSLALRLSLQRGDLMSLVAMHDARALEHLAHEALVCEQRGTLTCFLVQAVALLRGWHLATGCDPRQHKEQAKQYVRAVYLQHGMSSHAAGLPQPHGPVSSIKNDNEQQLSKDQEWRVRFAVDLYEVLGSEAFRAFEPLLLRTSLSTLQALAQRFWHPRNLPLLCGLLEVVHEQQLGSRLVEQALARWKVNKAKDNSLDDDAQQAALITFRTRVAECRRVHAERASMAKVALRAAPGTQAATVLFPAISGMAASASPAVPTLDSAPADSVSKQQQQQQQQPPYGRHQLSSVFALLFASFSANYHPHATKADASPAASGPPVASGAEAAALDLYSVGASADRADGYAHASAAVAAAAMAALSKDTTTYFMDATDSSPLALLEASAQASEALVEENVPPPMSVQVPRCAARTAATISNAPISPPARIQRGVSSARSSLQTRTPPPRAPRSSTTPAKRQRAEVSDSDSEASSSSSSSSSSSLADGTDDDKNQAWQASCAEGFAVLLQRYPHQLRPVAPVSMGAAERALQSSADSCVLLMAGIPSTVVPDDGLAHDEALVALGHPEVPQIITHLDAAHIEKVHDTLDGRAMQDQPVNKKKVLFRFEPGEHYFLSDMALPQANAQMLQWAQRMRQGGEAGGTHSDGITCPAAPELAAVLQGGAFAYVVPEGEAEGGGEAGSGWALPHGAGDWTVSHHLCGQGAAPSSGTRRVSRREATAGLGAASTAMFPLFFHCESHRAGAVNWRLKDVHVVLESRSQRLSAVAGVAAGAPAYWLCVDSEAENMALFHRVMAERTRSSSYSVDQVDPPALRSVEPLLRAGVCMRLLTQREHELVVLAPGVPHCVFTPPAATQISRNWTTPRALLAAAVRTLCGTAGERAERIRVLNKLPLRCVLHALRRLRVAQPRLFEQLVAHPQSCTHLHFLLGRAAAAATEQEGAKELQAIGEQIGSWMHQVTEGQTAAAPQTAIAPARQAGRAELAAHEAAMEVDDEDEQAGGRRGDRPTTAAASAAFASGANALDMRFAARCRAYRDELVTRLQRECPLSTALHVLDGLLLASVPPATVQELCAELTAQQGAATTVQEVRRAVDTALKQGHPRAAKRQCLDAAEQEMRALLQDKLHRANVPLPDMWVKLATFKERLESMLPLEQRPEPLSVHEWRGKVASWPASLCKLYRRLLLLDLPAFLPSSEGDAALPRVLYAAPEADDFLHWRAILCGPLDSRWHHVTVQIQVKFPPDYPASPPSVRIVTPIFHPNVSAEEICASVLSGPDWSPSYTLEHLLLILQSLLTDPNSASPLNAEAAWLYEHEPQQYWARVDAMHEHNMNDASLDAARMSDAAPAVQPDDAPLCSTPSLRSVLAPPSLLTCARRWAASVGRRAFGKPYQLHTDQQEQLLRAVRERVTQDCATESGQQQPHQQRPFRSDKSPLSPSDEMRMRSVVQLIVTSPQYFSQLHAMLSRPRVRKGAAATSQSAALQEHLDVYEFIRDTGLRYPNRIGSDAADPDSRSAVRASLGMGSNMEEAAFTGILQRHIQRAPTVSLVHVPPQLLCSWAMLAEGAGGGGDGLSADAAMRSWCEEHREVLLGATYIAFHWSHGHYCSLVLNLDVWRRGPPEAVAASAPLVSALPVPESTNKQRKSQPTDPLLGYSRSEHAVPFLHLDTLMTGCRFLDVPGSESTHASMLLRICRTLNRLCGTTWPTGSTSDWTPHVHVCGPPQQRDEWSCGYRLLRAWELLLAAGPPFSPQRTNEACASMAALSLEQLVQDTCVQYVDESELSMQLSPLQPQRPAQRAPPAKPSVTPPAKHAPVAPPRRTAANHVVYMDDDEDDPPIACSSVDVRKVAPAAPLPPPQAPARVPPVDDSDDDNPPIAYGN